MPYQSGYSGSHSLRFIAPLLSLQTPTVCCATYLWRVGHSTRLSARDCQPAIPTWCQWSRLHRHGFFQQPTWILSTTAPFPPTALFGLASGLTTAMMPKSWWGLSVLHAGILLRRALPDTLVLRMASNRIMCGERASHCLGTVNTLVQ